MNILSNRENSRQTITTTAISYIISRLPWMKRIGRNATSVVNTETSTAGSISIVPSTAAFRAGNPC